jgi:hypothetical protein
VARGTGGSTHRLGFGDCDRDFDATRNGIFEDGGTFHGATSSNFSNEGARCGGHRNTRQARDQPEWGKRAMSYPYIGHRPDTDASAQCERALARGIPRSLTSSRASV